MYNSLVNHFFVQQMHFVRFSRTVYFFRGAAFVKGDKPNQFPGLSIRYVRGADPVIKLMDEDRIIQQTFGIEKWDTDTIEAFLQSRLRQ